MRETESPSRLLRMCPRCNGLLVLGDEYSMSVTGSSGAACVKPNWLSVRLLRRKSTHTSAGNERFRKPFTTLKSQCKFSLKNPPTSVATASGDLRACFTNGNITMV